MSNNMKICNAILIDRSYVLELIESLSKAYREQQTNAYVMLETEETEKPKIIMFNHPGL